MEAAGQGLVETASDDSSASSASSVEILDGMPEEDASSQDEITAPHFPSYGGDIMAAAAAAADWPFSDWPVPEASSDELRRMLPFDMVGNYAVVYAAIHRPHLYSGVVPDNKAPGRGHRAGQ